MDHRPVRAFIQILPRNGDSNSTARPPTRCEGDTPKELTRIQRITFCRHLIGDNNATKDLTNLQESAKKAALRATEIEEPTTENQTQILRRTIRILKSA